MGLAGNAERGSVERQERFAAVQGLIDASVEAWKQIEDLAGQMEMLAKKASVFKLMGDEVAAEGVAERYLAVRKRVMASYVDAS